MNNKGQVGIIVAILIVTLLISVLVVVQVYYIPKWMKEREAGHMDTVANQFAELKYSLDLESAERTSTPLTNSITLGSKELPYFASSRAFGSLQILSSDLSNFSISISGNGMTSQLSTVRNDGNPASYILSINLFELVINSVESGDFYNATFYTITNNVTENISKIYVKVGNFYDGMLEINLTIINRSQTVFNQTVAVGLREGSSYTINLLNEDYKFSTHVLPSIPTPFNISFNTSSNGNFNIICYKYTPGSISYSNSFGKIKYEADNAYFVDQHYIYEGGAVILSQSGGNSLIYPPLFSFSNSTRTLNITLINIMGITGKTGVSGYGTYSIRTNYSHSNSYRCYGYSLIINITTNYPNAWYKYLSDEMERGGFSDYNITSTNNKVSIEISNITLILNIPVIYAQVGPGWIT